MINHILQSLTVSIKRFYVYSIQLYVQRIICNIFTIKEKSSLNIKKSEESENGKVKSYISYRNGYKNEKIIGSSELSRSRNPLKTFFTACN